MFTVGDGIDQKIMPALLIFRGGTPKSDVLTKAKNPHCLFKSNSRVNCCSCTVQYIRPGLAACNARRRQLQDPVPVQCKQHSNSNARAGLFKLFRSLLGRVLGLCRCLQRQEGACSGALAPFCLREEGSLHHGTPWLNVAERFHADDTS